MAVETSTTAKALAVERGIGARSGELAELEHAPVSALRGAGVEVDPRRVALVVVALAAVTLAIVGSVLALAGARRNDQIARLQHHGVPVSIVVAECQALLGGSGSNAAGYSCSGTFQLAGHAYRVDIPGLADRRPGSTVSGVSLPGDPRLVTTAALWRSERVSWRVYLLPALLMIGALVLGGALTLRWRR